jgi:tetratricopeptide (TPR) repeat protein
MRISITLFFLCFISINVLFAQKEQREANYNFKSQSYHLAAKQYQKLYSRDTNNLEYAYRLGVSYLYSVSDIEKAKFYLEKAAPAYSEDGVFFLELALACFYNNTLEKSDECFLKAKGLLKSEEEKQLADNWLQMAKNAKKYYSNPLDVSLVNLGKKINSDMDETTPLISFDGSQLFFSSNEKFDRTFQVYTYDVNYVDADDGLFLKAKSLSSINTVDDEMLAGISAHDGKVIAQLMGYEAFQDLGYAEFDGRRFGKKALYTDAVNSKAIESSAFETITGDTLLFASDREGGFGGFDLYLSKRLPDGTWSEAQNLGESVNSAFDEEFPQLSRDGKTLYFASNNLKSMGGYDVFKASVKPDFSFGEAQNLGYPINDVFDNKTFALAPNNRYAYISKVRKGGFGGYDLYRVVFNQEDPLVRIFLVELFLGEGEGKRPVTAVDSLFQITVSQKGGLVFGEYAFNKEKNQATVALPPGHYTLEIEGTKTKLLTKKIVVPDEPGIDKISKLPIVLELKE